MGKHEHRLDWQMLEEGAPWPPPSASTLPRPSKSWRLPQYWMRWALGILAAILLPALAEGAALLQLIAGTLTRHSVSEALVGARVCNWRLLLNGLDWWLLWEHSDLPSPVRYAIDRGFQGWLIANPYPELAWFSTSSAVCSSSVLRSIEATGLVDRVAAVSIVDYAMMAYGRGRLPALLDGIKRYDTWDTLIPAVYGVSAAEFEAGWRDYLIQERK